MRFILFVEGYTEVEGRQLSAYLKRWLDPRLSQSVGISATRFDGWAELLKDASTKATLHLQGPRAQEIIGVIGLIDLYGPTIYPAGMMGVAERFNWIKAEVEKKVNQPKYRQFCAVHELEAWLLSQPALFPREIQDRFPNTIQRPESVNFDNPPCKLLERLYKQCVDRRYKKRVDGPNLFSRADPEKACEKYPYFKQMLYEMLSMAHEAGL